MDVRFATGQGERNPEDARSVSLLAQTYFDSGDFVNARKWYARQIEMGGSDEETYFAKWRIAQSMAKLDTPWPNVQDAYLRTWEFRPTRAEPLYASPFTTSPGATGSVTCLPSVPRKSRFPNKT